MNPFRYRGYVYDWEVGLYYLQSRYYIPDIARFLNADDYPMTGQGFTGSNMFVYCGNNPVSRADNCGEWWHIAIGAIVGAAVSFVSSVADDVISGEKVSLAKAGASAAFGAVSGALAATGLPPVAQITGGAIISAGEEIINQAIENEGFDNIDLTEVCEKAIIGGVCSISNGVSKATSNHLYKQADVGMNRITNGLKNKSGSLIEVAKPTVKYYFSQTTTLFYEPMIRGAGKDLAFYVVNSFGEQLYVKAR